MFNPVFWWILTGILLMIAEFIIPGIILVFFGLGALITALLSLLIPALSINWQLSIFIITSLLSLFSLRHWFKQIFTGNTKHATGDGMVTEGLAGEEGIVITAITPDLPGKIQLHGTTWKAKSADCIEPGTHVTVIDQKSLTLIVKSK